MGMRLDLRRPRASGGGCRFGMADRSDSPRVAVLRGREKSWHWHREAEASRTAAGTSAQTPDADPDDLFADEDLLPDQDLPRAMPYRRRRIGVPAFLRGRAVRRILVTFTTLVVIAAVAVGALFYRLSSGPIAL